MILKNYNTITRCIVLMILLSATTVKGQDCKNTPKDLAPYLEAMLKGTSNAFYTPRVAHDFTLSQTQKLPENAEEKEAFLKERYFKYLDETEADLITLRNTFRTKGILPDNLRIVGAMKSESQVVKSNRPKGFAAPLPEDEQIHLEVHSILYIVDNNAGIYSKRMLINAYMLENNGYYSLMKIDSNPVSDLSNYETLIKNFRVKFPELLSYTYLADDNLRNIHFPGKVLARVQVNGEGSTTVLKISDEKVTGLAAHQTADKIKIAEDIPRSQLSKTLNEVQGALSLYGSGNGFYMRLSGLIDKNKHIPFIYDFISKSAFRKEGNEVIKYFRVCYREGKYREKSLPASLIVSPNDNGSYRMDLIVGKEEK